MFAMMASANCRRLELGRAFHLAREVVGDLLLADGLLERRLDQSAASPQPR